MVDGGDSPLSGPGPPGAAAATVEDYQPFADARLTEAPILLLVFFHKALRAEFKEIRRLVSAALESGSQWSELVPEAQRRLEFVKLAYKYHCAAEDEVIFLALDAHINNVACTYSLEHKSIDGLFASVFHCFSVLTKDNGYNKPLQELASSIGTLHSAICKHMIKEEKQAPMKLLVMIASVAESTLNGKCIT